jgi:hypothetical protein
VSLSHCTPLCPCCALRRLDKQEEALAVLQRAMGVAEEQRKNKDPRYRPHVAAKVRGVQG